MLLAATAILVLLRHIFMLVTNDGNEQCLTWWALQLIYNETLQRTFSFSQSRASEFLRQRKNSLTVTWQQSILSKNSQGKERKGSPFSKHHSFQFFPKGIKLRVTYYYCRRSSRCFFLHLWPRPGYLCPLVFTGCKCYLINLNFNFFFGSGLFWV